MFPKDKIIFTDRQTDGYNCRSALGKNRLADNQTSAYSPYEADRAPPFRISKIYFAELHKSSEVF